MAECRRLVSEYGGPSAGPLCGCSADGCALGFEERKTDIDVGCNVFGEKEIVKDARIVRETVNKKKLHQYVLDANPHQVIALLEHLGIKPEEVPIQENPFKMLHVILGRLGKHDYDGGVSGTCYQCPFSDGPLDANGNVARWDDVAHDPTEAYFRCNLPGRDPEEIAWGEYAPCDESEWRSVGISIAKQIEEVNG
jgi:hypothetical protein